MQKLKDLFNHKKHTYSFELFPPKTEEGYNKLLHTIEELSILKPDFLSCTYGAGGGSRDKTIEIVEQIQNKHQIIGVAHLTCVLHTKNEIKAILEYIKSHGISNLLALRGDPPRDTPFWKPGNDNFKYSSELCAFIKKNFDDHFSIGVAGFPEGHVLCPDRDQDAKFMKKKIDNGGEFIITQLFFNNQDYFEYADRLKKLGLNIRIIPGILPITDYQALIRFTNLCGASITDEVTRIFKPLQDNKEKTIDAGIEFAIRQCSDLLKNGAPGLHFYCLNKVFPSNKILEAVRI